MIRENVGGASHVDRSLNLGGRAKSYLAFLFMAFCAMILPNWASAAAPPAGAVIGNQAVASYTDAGGNERTTTSNLVSTNILQVAGVDIEANLTRNTAPGSTVYLPHTITNTGNGNDKYNLTTAQLPGDYNFTNMVIYADANGDGVPDNFTPLTSTPTLAPGQVFNIVIAAQVPANATNGQQSQLKVTTTSQFDNTVTDSNTDTVKITTNANVPVTKSLSVQSGPAGTLVTVTLTYTNNGANTATNLTLTDNLDARYVYQTGTGLWSATLPTALTDAADGNENGVDYSVSGQVVTAKIASVAAGQSGFVKFTVKVVDGTLPGVIPNKAGVTYGDGGGNTVVSDTNTSNFKVDPVVSVRLSDINSTSDTDATQNDVVTAPPAAQGATVIFDNVVKNTGNGVDTFNVTYDQAASNYPAGTSFQLLRADDTPMTDSNGDGVVDTGPLAPGAEFHVHLRVILPINATGSGPFDIVKKATSVTDPTKSDTTTDRLLGITGNTVDLTNNSAATTAPAAPAPGQGVNPTGENAAVTTNAVNPGQSTDFTLFVNNTSASPDSYNLAASTDRTFGSSTLPTGWSVVFRNAVTNAVIANTGTIASGANLKVIATVTVPAGQAPGTTDIFFRAQSPTSGALDVKHDAVMVNSVIDLSITPNNVGQGFPGGQVVYKHTLSNNGNTLVTDAPISFTNSTAGWNSVIWYDKNGNGVIDAADVQIDNVNDIPGGLPAGAQAPLLVQVFVPSGATDSAANTTTVTVKAVGDTNAANDSATDTTTVQPGNVSITKRQALDAACDGTADGAFVSTQLSAKPDQCLIYQITLTNLGTQSISNAVISDATPSFTTYVAGRGSVTPSGTLTEPAGGTAGTVKANVGGSIASGSNATLTFSVRIDK